MCWLFNREFYRCLRLVIQDHVNEGPHNRRFLIFLPIFCVVVVVVSSLCIYFFTHVLIRVLSSFCLILIALVIMHTFFQFRDETLAKLNATDTSETSSSRRETPSSSIGLRQDPAPLESYLEWLRTHGYFPHWSPSGRSNAEAERLRAIRENNQYLLQINERLHSYPGLDSSIDEISFTENEHDCYVESNLLPRVTHRGRHPSTEEQSIAESSSIENGEDSDVESNLLSQVTHRSRHPSTSAEAQPITSSHFVTEAEVYRPNSEESD